MYSVEAPLSSEPFGEGQKLPLESKGHFQRGKHSNIAWASMAPAHIRVQLQCLSVGFLCIQELWWYQGKHGWSTWLTASIYYVCFYCKQYGIKGVHTPVVYLEWYYSLRTAMLQSYSFHLSNQFKSVTQNSNELWWTFTNGTSIRTIIYQYFFLIEALWFTHFSEIDICSVKIRSINQHCF